MEERRQRGHPRRRKVVSSGFPCTYPTMPQAAGLLRFWRSFVCAIWGQDEADLGTSSQRRRLDLLVASCRKQGGSGASEAAPRSGPRAANVRVEVPVRTAGGDAGVRVGESSSTSSSVAGEISSEESLEESSEESEVWLEELGESEESEGGEEWVGGVSGALGGRGRTGGQHSSLLSSTISSPISPLAVSKEQGAVRWRWG